MSLQYDIATSVAAIITANVGDMPLPITPEVTWKVDVDLDALAIGTRKCYVNPAGFDSTSVDRAGNKARTYYIDIVMMEAVPPFPNASARLAWYTERGELVEAIEDLKFSSVNVASWEDSAVIGLLYDSPTADEDAIWFQVVRLEFSE